MIPLSIKRDSTVAKMHIASLEAIALALPASDSTQRKAMSDFCSLYTTLLKINYREGGIFAITKDEQNILEGIALKNEALAPTINSIFNFVQLNLPYVDGYDLNGTRTMQFNVSDERNEGQKHITLVELELFQLYPNPTDGFVSLKFKEEGKKEITIYSLLGNVVKTITSNGLQVELDVTHLEAGQYLVKVSTENKIQEVKRMILRK